MSYMGYRARDPKGLRTKNHCCSTKVGFRRLEVQDWTQLEDEDLEDEYREEYDEEDPDQVDRDDEGVNEEDEEVDDEDEEDET